MTKRQREAESDRVIRCAVYTRKSSEEGLDQDFNSLDAQREAAESFIASQRAEGWRCIPTRYDDGGFTGGNIDRPAVQRLLADIDAGLIDCVVVYKVDRLSRSLLDFARMMESFERHGVSFVSVTQQFNTTHSMGRLTLNILLSFAQFEREIISERTRDKIAATKRKGMWSGGRPILGYDIDRLPGGNRLVVNAAEAERVRRIFELYLECGSVLKTMRRLDEMGWRNKSWTTKGGVAQGGRGFEPPQLLGLLTNVAYLGKVKHKDDVYDGLHDAIVDQNVFDRVAETLKANRSGDGRGSGNKHGALLKGLVRCKACGCAMIHHYASDRSKAGIEKHYRYYVCTNAQKRGWSECPAPSLPAQELERFVVDQLRSLGRDDALMAEAVRGAQEQLRERVDELDAERTGVSARHLAARDALRELVDSGQDRNGSAARASELRSEIGALTAQQRRLDARLTALRNRMLDEDELVGALEAFDPMWTALASTERERLIHLLVQSVEYDAASESLSVTFHAQDDATLEEVTCQT
ncbi:MAG: recombinase family protein [Phycisphaeraceae bacterium]|nr:recombinase family protein [Phycisphaeraceae bacterium]